MHNKIEIDYYDLQEGFLNFYHYLVKLKVLKKNSDEAEDYVRNWVYDTYFPVEEM